jgi:hypothetical protein
VLKCVQRGLSLAEVVLAVGLLTIIAVTVAGVFTHLLNASAKTTDVTAGRTLARRILDRGVRAGPDKDWGFPDTWPTVPVDRKEATQIMTVQASETQSEFFYSLHWELLKPADDLEDGIDRQIFFVEVEVTWWGTDSKQGRSELGRLSTKISQVARYHR